MDEWMKDDRREQDGAAGYTAHHRIDLPEDEGDKELAGDKRVFAIPKYICL